VYPKPLSYFVCLLMPIEQIVEFKKKEEHSNLKAKVHFLPWHAYLFFTPACVYIKIYLSQVSCYLSDLVNYSEEEIYVNYIYNCHFTIPWTYQCVSTDSYLFITYLLIDTFTGRKL
jgi:hypothetical protein